MKSRFDALWNERHTKTIKLVCKNCTIFCHTEHFNLDSIILLELGSDLFNRLILCLRHPKIHVDDEEGLSHDKDYEHVGTHQELKYKLLGMILRSTYKWDFFFFYLKRCEAKSDKKVCWPVCDNSNGGCHRTSGLSNYQIRFLDLNWFLIQQDFIHLTKQFRDEEPRNGPWTCCKSDHEKDDHHDWQVFQSWYRSLKINRQNVIDQLKKPVFFKLIIYRSCQAN